MGNIPEIAIEEDWLKIVNDLKEAGVQDITNKKPNFGTSVLSKLTKKEEDREI